MMNQEPSTRIEEIKGENTRLIVSIILSTISIALISMLILVLPKIQGSITSSIPYQTNYSTFFYEWAYWTNNGTYYTVSMFKPTTGYFIFASLALVLLAISNSCSLLKSVKRTKQLIFINWGLYAIPITVFIVKIILVARNNTLFYLDAPIAILITLGFYSLFYIPLQIMFLLEKKTLKQFFSLQRKEHGYERNELIRRRINAVFTVMVYLFTVELVFDALIEKATYVSLVMNYIVSIVVIIWFFSNLAIYRYKNFNRTMKNLFGIIICIIIIPIIIFLTIMIDVELFIDMFGFTVYDLAFPKTLMTTLFYSSIVLLMSIPISFFAFNKKDMITMTSIYAICVLGINLFMLIFAFTESVSIGTKIFYFFLYMWYFSLVYAGGFWGRFLGRKLLGKNTIQDDNNTEVQETKAV